jgi:hypothetical protein
MENRYIMQSKILMFCVQKTFIHSILLPIENIHKKDINLCYPMDFNHKFILWGIVKHLTYIKNCFVYLFKNSCNPSLRMTSYIEMSLLFKITLWRLSWSISFNLNMPFKPIKLHCWHLVPPWCFFYSYLCTFGFPLCVVNTLCVDFGFLFCEHLVSFCVFQVLDMFLSLFVCIGFGLDVFNSFFMGFPFLLNGFLNPY